MLVFGYGQSLPYSCVIRLKKAMSEPSCVAQDASTGQQVSTPELSRIESQYRTVSRFKMQMWGINKRVEKGADVPNRSRRPHRTLVERHDALLHVRQRQVPRVVPGGEGVGCVAGARDVADDADPDAAGVRSLLNLLVELALEEAAEGGLRQVARPELRLDHNRMMSARALLGIEAQGKAPPWRADGPVC